jgi:hypothetical protein
MSRRNWARVNRLALMRRRGVEDVNGGMPLPVRVLQRPHIIATPRTKTELRREAAKAFMAWRAKRGPA